MSKTPLVSIGVPVYNEERYIDLTIDSLLSQNYPNLEIIISDNASTDSTSEICQARSKSDSRVRYFRSEQNEGAVNNFNTAFRWATGKYFMWAGAHDLWDPTFISKAVTLLEAEPTVILVYPQTMVIDSEGVQSTTVPDEIDTRHLLPLQRYLKFIWRVHWCNMIHGLIRSDVIRETKMFRHIWGSDILLLTELSLAGEFAQIPETLFYRRENRPHVEQTTVDDRKDRYLKTLEGSRSTEQHSQMSTAELFGELRAAILQVLKNSNLAYQQMIRAQIETTICFRIHYGVSFPGDLLLMNWMRVSNKFKRISS
jgi:glycosyltransferase involved in cell wall biosynthesis